MAKIIISIGPTFHDSRTDIYHKASVMIEYDDEEKAEEEVFAKLKALYKKAVKLERSQVITYVNRTSKRKRKT